MRIAVCYLGVVVVFTALGCQPKSDNITSGETVSEPSTVTQQKSAISVENAEPESTVTEALRSIQSQGTTSTAAGWGEVPVEWGEVPVEWGEVPVEWGEEWAADRCDGGNARRMTTLHAMFADRDKIRRTITNLPDGAEATTESDDEEITKMLQEHVPAMEDRVLGNKPLPPMTFHPIFVELIKIGIMEDTLTYEETAKGMKVKYSSDDPYVVMLVQEHAKLVSRFIKNGMQEIHKPYTLPQLDEQTRNSARDKRKAIAAKAKDSLFTRLSGRLMEVMQSAGPAAAIDVCSQEAVAIAEAVGKEYGVAIGRTSFRLRNPANAPRDWVKPFVEQRSDTPQHVQLDDGN